MKEFKEKLKELKALIEKESDLDTKKDMARKTISLGEDLLDQAIEAEAEYDSSYDSSY